MKSPECWLVGLPGAVAVIYAMFCMGRDGVTPEQPIRPAPRLWKRTYCDSSGKVVGVTYECTECPFVAEMRWSRVGPGEELLSSTCPRCEQRQQAALARKWGAA